MARASETETKKQFNYEIRGFHVYKDSWKPSLDDRLFICHEADNPYDSDAIAVTTLESYHQSTINYSNRDDCCVVGHIPVEVSSVFKDYLTKVNITAVVSDSKFYRSNRADGLVIRCLFIIEGGYSHVNKFVGLIRRKLDLFEAYHNQLSSL
jgi:hypothetical protein